jgi:hypothetical protein
MEPPGCYEKTTRLQVDAGSAGFLVPGGQQSTPRKKYQLFQFHIKALSLLARLRLLNVLKCTPRSLNTRRLDIILDLESVLQILCCSIDLRL